MNIFKSSGVRAIVLAGAAIVGLASAPAYAAGSCDRACLRTALDAYLAAVNKHSPAAAPLAKGFRETENGVVVQPGDGLWKTAGGLGKVQRRYFDPVSGNAAFFGLVEEPGAPGPALVGMRIKVGGGKITEAEWIIARKGTALWNPDGLIALPPREDTPLPAAQRLSRERLLTVGASYFKGLTAHNGDMVIATDDCYRLENGTKMTGARPPRPAGAATNALPTSGPPGPTPVGGSPPVAGPPAGGPPTVPNCHSAFERLTKAVEAVVEQRFPVVDTEAGVVMGIGIFHPADDMKSRDGSPFPRLFLTEFFSAPQGKIVSVHAAITYLPTGAPEKTGW